MKTSSNIEPQPLFQTTTTPKDLRKQFQMKHKKGNPIKDDQGPPLASDTEHTIVVATQEKKTFECDPECSPTHAKLVRQRTSIS